MISFIKHIIDKRVDQRINEIIHDDSLEFKTISNSKAKKEISSFILENKEKSITKLSTLDFVLNLRLPADQVEDVLGNFKKEKKLKEVNA